MSTEPSSRKPPAPFASPSLADVLGLIEVERGSAPRRRQDQASAIRTLARALGRRPAEIPADPSYLRNRISETTAVMAGLAPRRWKNILSLARSALREAGLSKVPARNTTPLSASWADLLRHLNDISLRTRLSRLARWCSQKGIEPAAVDDSLVADFRRDLDGALVENPRTIERSTRTAWNRASSRCPTWPKLRLTVPPYATWYSLPWSALPPSLKRDVDACLDRLSGKDLLADLDIRPLKPSSLNGLEYDLRQLASAVVLRGHDPARLRSLADLVDLETAKEGLRFFLERSGNKPTARIHDLAYSLRTVAKYWVMVKPGHLEELTAICRRLSPGRHGMTEKNRALLRQFDSERNVASLITLPQRILAEVRRKKTQTAAEAVFVQIALAVELLIMVPIRIGNLVALNLDRHFIHTGSRGGPMVRLSIPAREVKNATNIEAELPRPTVALLDVYLKTYRPLLLNASSPWLFPGWNGRHKARNALADQITRVIARKTGLRVNPHLFRHIAAKLYLDRNPGAYGLIRLIHGHKSVETTTQYYCGTETPAAMRHFDEHILQLRERTAASTVGPFARGGR